MYSHGWGFVIQERQHASHSPTTSTASESTAIYMPRSRLPADGLLCQNASRETGSTSWEFYDARPHLLGGTRTLKGLQGWRGWMERARKDGSEFRLGGRFEEIALRPHHSNKGQPKLHDSILLLKDLVSQAECAQLVDAAEEKVRFYRRHRRVINGDSRGKDDKPLRRFELHPDGINHDGSVHALAHSILTRALWNLEQQEPELCAELFGVDDPVDLCDLWFQFKGDEPMLNRYTAGGDFPPHQDGSALTVLVPLSTSDVEFQGGGTAFWSEAEIGKDSKAAQGRRPSLVMKPPPGTGLFWRGHLTHAGLPLTTGCRHVFVASFDLRPAEQA